MNYGSDVSFNIVQNSVLALNVYYKTDYYTTVKEKPDIDFDTFVSNIGGNHIHFSSLISNDYFIIFI